MRYEGREDIHHMSGLHGWVFSYTSHIPQQTVCDIHL